MYIRRKYEKERRRYICGYEKDRRPYKRMKEKDIRGNIDINVNIYEG